MNGTEPRTHGSFVQQSRDAEDVVLTDVSHGAFDDVLAALQTSVALERIPRSLTVDPVEHVELPDPRHQHQLHREWRGDGESKHTEGEQEEIFQTFGIPEVKSCTFL